MAKGEKCYFTDSSKRGILDQVGRFGEELCSLLLGAEIFSDSDAPLTCADLFNYEERMAVQIKMCNQKHAQRPLPQQVENLYQEVVSGFLVGHGMYAFVFYNGCKDKKENNGKQRSKIRSKKLTRIERAKVLADELQFIHLVDIRLIRYIVRRHPKIVLKKNALVYEERHAKDRLWSLYLTRSFLNGFIQGEPLQKKLISQAFALGKNDDTRGMINTCQVSIRFLEAEGFEKKLPVFVVGRGDTVKAISRLIPLVCYGTIKESNSRFLHRT